jgi:hypothetical protein
VEVNAQLFDRAVKPETNAQRIAREAVERGNRPATDNQIRYIEGLRARKDIGTMGEIPADLTVTQASEAIEWLKARPYKSVAIPASVTYAPGLYLHGARVFRIVPPRKNARDQRTYAEEWLDLPEQDGIGAFVGWSHISFHELPLIVRMTEAEALAYAERFAAAHHQCVMCSRTLKVKESIARSMGPICAGRVA